MDNLNLEKIIAERNTFKGLTSKEAEGFLIEYGLNSRPAVKKKNWINRLVKIMGEPMMLLLLATAAVYFFLGDKLETSILLLTVIPIGLMEFFQEQKTDEAIGALDKMMVQYAEVYRDGFLKKMEIKYIVPGDLVYLTAGDRVPADGIILSSPGVSLDESILTGESISVVKSVLSDGLKQVKDENKLWQGTLVVQGEAYFLTLATGVNTAYGKIGSLMEKIISQKTPLQMKIYRLVRVVAIFAAFSALLIGLILALKQGWTSGVLGGLTIAMSLIPEEFPIVFSVFLIMGVWRMTRQKALIREMAMVETLGSATVICTDKTGTLTQGTMALDFIYYDGELVETKKGHLHPLNLKEIIVPSLLALEQVAIDPIEVEVQNFAKKIGIDTHSFFRERKLLQDSSFESKTKMVHHMWQEPDEECYQYTAGAPESVIAYSKLSETEKQKIEKAYLEMAAAGCRVVAIAKRSCSEQEKIIIKDLDFIGLLGMSDPPREGVKEAVDICQKAGIRIIMITGDNKLTAHNIAESIGLKHSEEIINGEDLEKMSPFALREAVKRHDIFTRVHPEQKYLIVEALQKQGEIVAMTGDGVNDAPALRQANIGIAMGLKGTEVARAASGIVLMDDNFATIVNAIKEGRRVYDNLRQAFVFLFSFHLPIVGLAFLPLMLGQSLVFLPIHIIFLELICDPAAVLGFERESPRRNLMHQPPRSSQEPLINPHLWAIVFIQGISILAVSFGFYYYFALVMGDMELGRTAAFTSLVLSQIFLIIFSREPHQVKTNKLLLGIVLLTFALVFLIVEVPILRKIFHLVELSWFELGLIVSVSMAVAFSLRILRMVKRKLCLAF
ncbi:MAG: ATPase, E1-E2 type [Candidatus Magasanikbacteria bacterium GW2011_GWC2_40_17]|uniref:ATPase, E1-E2 type n=1 Tax=Candidatus Magasanikbacteria bacterium GW2011_GWA2_42_32 TaxID=1619039 RepID=A0A0G1D5I9_9BACT|nr:MAG: ATPase, E1-E2 type [Candidatus Magasanikbacteria bacterium GW2011_GWC2_40_17]KKS57308.1 MAG: ATPase, E1-E2 type [Candidatus Magasanikbacteria bacterium GW2011_GWA2_42_32]OGH85792.1 MAG: hypothetical protein A2294_02385 [Candidatus Magasanikbacteria bacterium RIFOXYB2_FULL_38_10]